MTVLWVALGAALGAPARYLLDRAVQTRHDSVFPFGTLLVNVIGSLLLAILAALPAAGPVMAVAGTGFCGALSTYSTFSYETLRAAGDRARLLAALNVSISLIAGLGTVTEASPSRRPIDAHDCDDPARLTPTQSINPTVRQPPRTPGACLCEQR